MIIASGNDETQNIVSLQAYGGDSIIQRIKRVAFDAKSTIMVSGRAPI